MPLPPHHLDLTEETDAVGRTVIHASGDIDLRTAPDLRRHIVEAAADGRDVVLDLTDVRFMDSPGLGTLIYCYQRQEDAGAQLLVRSPQGHVRELFEVVALTHLIAEDG
jgi:anti-sigma B factor antagonist